MSENKTEIKTEELFLEAVEENSGNFYFIAESLNKDFECEAGLRILAEENINKPLVWRHRHPVDPQHVENHILGKIETSEVKNGKLITKYKVYKHTQDHLDFIEIVKERIKIGDPLGISMRYRKYRDVVSEKITHYDVFEHSGTPYPQCEKCKTIDYIGENKMPDDKKTENKKDETKEDEVDETEGKSDVDESLEKIKQLQESLDAKSSSLKNLESKVKTLEAELEKSKTVEKEKLTLEDRVMELEKEVDYFKKKPVLDAIFELKQLDKEEKEFYMNKNKDYLENKLEAWSKEVTEKIHVSSIEDSAKESEKKVDEEIESGGKTKKKEVSMEAFTSSLGKKVQEKAKNFKKGE